MMPLTPHEQKLLAAIENDLTGRDPELAKMLASPDQAYLWRRFPIAGRDLAALTAVLVAVIALHAVAGGLHPLLTGAVTAGLVLCWLLMAARNGRARDPAAPGWQRSSGPSKTTATCLGWIALAIAGAAIEGLLWFTIAAVGVLLTKAVHAAIRCHQASAARKRAGPEAGPDAVSSSK